MYYAITKNSLTYCLISRDCAVSRSAPVNMSARARPQRCAMATYSRKSSSNRGKRIEKVPKKDVIPIEEPEDRNISGEETQICDKSADEAVEKCKQAKVVIPRADPYEIFRMSTSDDESESKSMMKMAKGNNSDITTKEQDSEVALRDLQIDIPSENAIVEYVETDKDGRHENIHVATSMDTEDRTVLKDTTTSIPEETDAEDSIPEIVTVADVHVDAPVMEDSEIHDEPPKKIHKTVNKGAK